MDQSSALFLTLLVGGGLLYCGHYLTRKFYEKVMNSLFNELDKEGYLDIKKVNAYLKDKYGAKINSS